MDEPVLIYIAGPLTSSGLEHENVRSAIDAAEAVRRAGGCPFIPHLYVQWGMVYPGIPYDEWMRIDLAFLRRCDGLLRVRGASRGADIEWALAEDLAMPRVWHRGRTLLAEVARSLVDEVRAERRAEAEVSR